VDSVAEVSLSPMVGGRDDSAPAALSSENVTVSKSAATQTWVKEKMTGGISLAISENWTRNPTGKLQVERAEKGQSAMRNAQLRSSPLIGSATNSALNCCSIRDLQGRVALGCWTGLDNRSIGTCCSIR
jgi:hypothetical protein